MFSTKCRLWWIPSALQDRQDRSYSIGQPMGNLDRQSVQLAPSPGRSWDLGFFACLPFMEHERGAVVIACMLIQSTIFVLPGFQVPRIYQVPSALQDRWDRSSTLDRPQNCWNVGLGPNLSLPREKLGTRDFLLIIRYCARNRDYGQRVSQTFVPALMWMASRLPSTSFWIFRKWNLSIYVVESMCSWEEGESMALHSTTLLISLPPSLLNGNVDLLCNGWQMHRKHYELS